MAIQASIFQILPLICLFFSAVTAKSDSGHGVLAKLYQRAVHEHRPLVIVLDSENGPLHHDFGLKPSRNKHSFSHKHVHLENSISEDQPASEQGQLLQVLMKKITALVENRDIFQSDKRESLKKKTLLRTKEQQQQKPEQHQDVDPLLKKLLRVSNDMNCLARQNCEDAGKEKDECEQKFECDDKKDDGGCDVQEMDECDDGINYSTRGVTLEPEDNTCTRC